jgi:hypothetical protein
MQSVTHTSPQYDFLISYNPTMALMEELHECFMALEAGRFVAQDVVDRFELASREINRMLGYEPMHKRYAVLLQNIARQVQLLPDNYLYPRGPQMRRHLYPWA